MFKRRRDRDPVTAVDFVRYDEPARKATVLSNRYAIRDQHPQVATEHLALAFASPQIRDQLQRFVPIYDDVARLLDDRGYGRGTVTGDDNRPFSPEVRAIITATFALADAEDRHEIGVEHLLFALLDRPDTVGARLLLDLGIDPSRDAASWRVPLTDEPTPDGDAG